MYKRQTAAVGNINASSQTTKAGTGGSGSGLEIRLETDNVPQIAKIIINKPGKNYKAGDVITFSFDAGDAVATGSFDIIFSIPADISGLPGKMVLNTAVKPLGIDNDFISSSKQYINADITIGLHESEGVILSYVTNLRSGQSDLAMFYNIAFSGIDEDVTQDKELLKELSAVISHALKDAWQNPKSMPVLNDYLQGYFDKHEGLGIINATLTPIN